MLLRLGLAGCFAMALALCVAPLSGEEPGIAPSAHSILPFELRANFLIVVNGQIGSLEGMKFILDTGASFTVIDRKVAERLDLQKRPGKITNFDRKTTVEWADVPDFRVGPLQVGTFPVLVAKLTDYSDFAEGVDGIIGLDLLARSKRLLIDYQRQLISWEYTGSSTGRNSAPTFLSVPLDVQGARLHLVLDTGLQGILLYKDRLYSSLPRLRLHDKDPKVHFGRMQTTRFELPGVRLAGPEAVATVFLMDQPASGDPPGIDGYLGVATLNAKRVEFDFTANTFRWE
jgi:predicted aspartyl protease